MNNYVQKIELQDIPMDLKFQGYYWMSNKKLPEIIENENLSREWFSDLPFVIEANFYAPEEEISIQVKNIDGKYYVNRFDLKMLNHNMCEKKEYISHRLKSSKFYLVQTWKAQADELIEGMTTLVPDWVIFAGFAKN